MPIVKMPDGTQVRFPDDMPKEQIKGLIASKFPDVVKAQPVAKKTTESVSGSILPFTRDETGVHFDSDAGILGALKGAFTLPGDVYSGNVDVNSDEALERSLELAGAVSPAGPVSKAAKPLLTVTRKPKVKVPGSEQLKEAAKKAYEELGDAGVEYSIDSVDELARNIQDNLAIEKGIGDKLAPRTYGILRDLQTAPKGAKSVPFTTGLNSARKQLSRAGVRGDIINPEDPAAANFAARSILDYMEGPPKGSVLSGPPPAQVAAKLKEANANYAAAKRSEILNGIEDSAELRAAAANSGKNIGNTIRQRAVGLLDNKGSLRDRAGFTKDELQAIEKIARGSLAANVTRDVGNVLGGGGGLGSLAAGGLGGTVGYTAGGPIGALAGTAATAIVGRGAKSATNRLTKSALRKADKTTRQRSPLYDQKAAQAGLQKLTLSERQAVIGALRAELIAYLNDRRELAGQDR